MFTAYKNPATDWTKKVAAYYKPKPDNKNFKIGRREEEHAINLYEQKYQKKVTKMGLLVHPTCPWLGCSPDGIILQTKTVIEIKTIMNEEDLPFGVALRSVAYLKLCEGRYKLRQKHSHNAQIQLSMHLLGAFRGQLVVHNYKSKEILVVEVDYDKDFCLALIGTLKSVYFNFALPYIFENFTTEADKVMYN